MIHVELLPLHELTALIKRKFSDMPPESQDMVHTLFHDLYEHGFVVCELEDAKRFEAREDLKAEHLQGLATFLIRRAARVQEK